MEASSQKINLLHLLQTLGVGGAETLLLETIPALGMEHYRHYVYCFGPEGAIKEKIEKLGVPVIQGPSRLSIKNPIKFFSSLFRLGNHLLNFVREHHIHIIQSHLGQANHLGVIIGRLAGVPCFPTFHNTIEFALKRNLLDPRVYFVKAINFIIYKFSLKIVVVSEDVKEFMKRRFSLSDSRFIVLNNGILFNENYKFSYDINMLFPESCGKLKIISVGRLTYQKSFETLILAVSELIKRDRDDLFIMIAGDGEDRASLELMIKKNKAESCIKLLGIRHDIRELMMGSDIFVMPSRFEGLSIAMIEAMACGLAIIVSNAPGLGNHIKNRENGLVFPVDNYLELAECIRLLGDDEGLRARLAIGAKESFGRQFNMRNNIRVIDACFRKYAGQSAVNAS